MSSSNQLLYSTGGTGGSLAIFALFGAPYCAFLQFQVAIGHRVVYIVQCTLICKNYRRPAGQFVVVTTIIILALF